MAGPVVLVREAGAQRHLGHSAQMSATERSQQRDLRAPPSLGASGEHRVCRRRRQRSMRSKVGQDSPGSPFSWSCRCPPVSPCVTLSLQDARCTHTMAGSGLTASQAGALPGSAADDTHHRHRQVSELRQFANPSTATSRPPSATSHPPTALHMASARGCIPRASQPASHVGHLHPARAAVSPPDSAHYQGGNHCPASSVCGATALAGRPMG